MRGLRNKQKRESKIVTEHNEVTNRSIIYGVGMVTIAGVGLFYVVANDATGIGAADDGLIAPLGLIIREGLSIIFS